MLDHAFLMKKTTFSCYAECIPLYAETYDICISDWPGEIDFYREIISEEVKSKKGVVLELACGTGRVVIRLVQSNLSVVGLDRSPEMLEVAR